jgi:hypothetical protein
MIQRIRWFVLVSLLAALAACSDSRRAEPPGAEPAPNWNGVWRYEATLPPDAGGSPVTMRYVLTIADAGKTPSATLAIQGFQTDQTLLCDVEIAGSTLVLKFRSFGDGKTLNEFGVEQYRPGARLITLSRESAQGMITTEWEGLDPPAPAMPRKGLYFRARSSSEG